MVLGDKDVIRSFIAMIALGFLTHPALAGGEVESIHVEGVSIEINAVNDQCEIKAGDELFSLESIPPCFVLKKENGEIESYSYKDIGVDAVIMVVGNPISESIRELYGLEQEVECGSVSHGILIKNKNVSLSKTVLRNGVYCKEYGADEKNYWMFAHEE